MYFAKFTSWIFSSSYKEVRNTNSRIIIRKNVVLEIKSARSGRTPARWKPQILCDQECCNEILETLEIKGAILFLEAAHRRFIVVLAQIAIVIRDAGNHDRDAKFADRFGFQNYRK